MGMFDELRCEYLLPVPGFEGRTFQTKSFECVSTFYTITSDGKLTCADDEKAEAKPVDFTGSVEFGGCLVEDDPQSSHWSFTALFESGQLQRLIAHGK